MKGSGFFYILLINVFFVNTIWSEDSLVVGVVPQFDARYIQSTWGPILKRISHETGHVFRFEGSSNIGEFEKKLSNGLFDFAYMNPYHLIVAHKKHGYLPVLNDNSKLLQGVLVVKKEAQVNTIKQLDKQKVAFPSPNALGASLQMRQELYDYFNVTVVPVYVKTHTSVYINVLLGETMAGGGVIPTLRKAPQEYQDNLVVIHKTKPIPPHPIVYHPRVSRDIVQAVVRVLLAMGEEKEGTILLGKIPIKKIGPVMLTDYELIKKMDLNRFYVKPQ